MNRAPLLGFALALLSPLSQAAPTQAGAVTTQLAKLLPQNALQDDQIGHALELDGDLLAVGAPKHGTGAAPRQGVVYVYRGAGTAWNLEAQLQAVAPVTDARMGSSLSMDGGTLVAGAPESSGGGVTYVFALSGAIWNQEAQLLSSDLAASDDFGHAVSIDGDTVVVGAPADDDLGGSSGSAYVFERVGTQWSQLAKLLASDGSGGHCFGDALALEGSTLIVGAPRAGLKGTAYVFQRSGTAWVEVQKLTPTDAMFAGHFAHAIDLDGDVAVFGAVRNNTAMQLAGAAYVFRRSGTSWTEEVRLNNSDALPYDRFGWSVSVQGDEVLVGASRHGGLSLNAGKVYLFRRSGTQWSEVDGWVGDDTTTQDLFGGATCIDGLHYVVGAQRVNAPWAANTGAVYAFLRPVPPTSYCTGKTSSLGCVPFVAPTGSPSASSTAPFSVHARDVLPDQAGILFYGYAKANLGFHGGKRCVKAPFQRLTTKMAKASGTPPCSGVLTRNFNARIQSGADPLLTPGRLVTVQWLQRDPTEPTGFGDNLTDGIVFTIQP